MPYMTLMKHILVVTALLVISMPCCHAASHVDHGHDAEVTTELCAPHTCGCHSCDDVACAEKLEMPQNRSVSASAVLFPVSFSKWIVFNEPRVVAIQPSLAIPAGLASIRTIRLLI